MFGNALVFRPGPVAAWHSTSTAEGALQPGPVAFRMGAKINDGAPALNYNANCVLTVNPGIPGISIVQVYDSGFNPIPSNAVPIVGGGFNGYIMFNTGGVPEHEVGFIADATDGVNAVQGQSLALFWLVP